MPVNAATLKKKLDRREPAKEKDVAESIYLVKYHRLYGESNVPNQTLRPDNVLPVLQR